MSDDSIYDDINLTKRKTITNGKKYDFYIYKTLKLEKKFSKGKFGKGDTSISQVKNYKLQDDESDAMLDVKLKVSKNAYEDWALMVQSQVGKDKEDILDWITQQLQIERL